MKFDIDELVNKIDRKMEEIEQSEKEKNGIELPNKIEMQLNKDSIEEIYNQYFDELNKLVGLEEVKTEIKKLINYLIFIKKLNNKVNLDQINLNMIFRGNPGTGKTTVAKIIANILCKLGFLKTNKMIETTPRDFIAGYVGQTAEKAKKTINRAAGGIVFIDEAYTFSQSADESGHTYVYEAITEIIKEMEKLNTIFIFSGYSNQMDDFVELNPGIKSRIGYDIKFNDYSKEELFKMFKNKLDKSGLKLSKKASKLLLEKIEQKMTIKNFGNGRMIDNLFNEVLKEHATINLNETNYEKLLLITEESINKINIKIKGGMNFG